MIELDTASAGDHIDPAGLQPAVAGLGAMATDLDALIATSSDMDAVQAMGRMQATLRSRAARIVDAQIDLLAGEARITADHVNLAVTYTQAAVAKIEAWKVRLEKIALLVDFLAVLPTGSGGKIVQAAYSLKHGLDEIGTAPTA